MQRNCKNTDKNTPKSAPVKSFYGSKNNRNSFVKRSKLYTKEDADNVSKHKLKNIQDFPTDKHKSIDTYEEKNISDTSNHCTMKRKINFYSRNEIFWTKDVYGKRNSTPDSIKKKNKNSDVLSINSNIENKIVEDDIKSKILGNFNTDNSLLKEGTEKLAEDDLVLPTEVESDYIEDMNHSFSSEIRESANSSVISSADTETITNDTINDLANLNKSQNDSKICETPKSQKTLYNYFSRTNKSQSSEKKRHNKSFNDSFSDDSKSTRQTTLINVKSSHMEDTSESPLFELPISPSHKNAIGKKKHKQYANQPHSRKQMYIDIGQKDFGHLTCPTCGMVYTKSQEDDEVHHAKYHQKIVQKLKFMGWKTERILEQYHDGRITGIYHGDSMHHLKKLADVKDIVDTELGFNATQMDHLEQKGFIFISSKKIVGCVIAVSIKEAYPILEDTSSQDKMKQRSLTHSWCCSTEPKSAICGISRLWVFSQCRRQNIATRLVECVRHHFMYGCVIPKNKLAFSDPTPNGRAFATKYVGIEKILVFR